MKRCWLTNEWGTAFHARWCGGWALLILLATLTWGATPGHGQTEESAAPGADPAAGVETPSAPLAKPPPLLTPEEYAALAATLRDQYTKPPAEWPAPTVDADVAWQELGKVPAPVHPEGNPFTKEKARLGMLLFFDARLSGTNEMACASCHDPDLAWGDGRTVSFGRRRVRLPRNAPSLVNAGLRSPLFWDGRAVTLEDQAITVMSSAHEMNGNGAEVLARLQAAPGYVEAFAKVFGEGGITLARVTQALACFERTLTTRRNLFDRFLAGDANALSDSAVRGLHLYRTKARCMNCHSGPLMTDQKFHDVGLSYYGRKFQDLGRYEVTRDPAHVGQFLTPSLRNLSATGPYMHNGLFPLDGVLRMYNFGMPTLRPKPEQKDDPLFPKKDPLLLPLLLNSQELTDLKAFLESLTELPWRIIPPELPASAEVTPASAAHEGGQ